ncbi:MAG TPA: D-glycero-beta-D-manno-heptose 1-phosphate adenylyltransferase [Candidatus Polarisedimenticolaceae bacterium]
MNPADLEAAIARLAERRLLVVGDLMLDEYVWGDVSRISPDAPVQVVEVRRRTFALGGAGNVAHNAAVAGARVALCGFTGADEAGRRLIELARGAGIDPAGIVEDLSRPTTVKTRVVARGQHLVRLDEESTASPSAEARESILRNVSSAAARAEAVLYSDYAKGACVPGALAAIRAANPRVPIVVDPKSADVSIYAGCTAITPNKKEAEAAAGMRIRSHEDLATVAARIRAACGAPFVLVTLGPEGMALSGPDGSVHRIVAQAREVYDVTGAGDTVLAYFGLALGAGLDARDAATLANVAAGIAVARVGTSAVAPTDLLQGQAAGKALDLRQAVNRVEHERSLGRRIVFTNGCFDLLHAGHVHLLERARAKGDFLVVAVNSDASVRRLKGPERPVVGQDDRVKILAALDAVGAVVVFDDDTPLAHIEALRPDVLVKGGDYTIETIVGAPFVLGYGGRVETVPLAPGRSTTSILESLRGDERS